MPKSPLHGSRSHRLSRMVTAIGLAAGLAVTGALTAPQADAAPAVPAAPAAAPAAIPDAEMPYVTGPHPYSVTTVADWRTPIEFGAVDFFNPTDIEGRLPTVVVMPGLTGSRNTVRYVAEDLASHGFGVMLMDSFSTADADLVRTNAMRRALGWMVNSSPARARIDADKIGVWGFSYGATAALNNSFTVRSPNVRAAVAVFPLSTLSIYPLVTDPTLVLGGENDVVAPPALHARIAYNVARGPKAYGQLDRAQHLDPTGDDGAVSSLTVSWFKVHLGVNDEYRQFLCPAPTDSYIENWETSGLC